MKRSSWTCYCTPCSESKSWAEGYPRLEMAGNDAQIAAVDVKEMYLAP